MKYYKTKENKIRAIGEKGDIDDDQSFLVGKDWIELTKEEAEAITNPPLTIEQLLQNCINQRQSAYKNESDPLYLEAIFDNDDNKMQSWKDKVQEIKERYPKPEE
jgi:hypothetical protein